MKQFLYVTSLLSNGADISTLVDNQMAFVKKGSTISEQTFTNFGNTELNIYVKENNFVNQIPLHTDNITYNISKPSDATAFKAVITLNSGQYVNGNYSLIIAKKGVPFNQRNKWTVNTYLPATGNYADDVADTLIPMINALQFVKATKSTSNGNIVITIDAVEEGEDYTVMAVDKFEVVKPTIVETKGVPARNNAKAVVDLFNKCAADRGINYTYSDTDIYPKLPFNPLKGSDSADAGFYIINIRYSEPRIVKTTNEVVNQVLHIVLPKSAQTVCSAIETVLGKIGKNMFPEASAAATDLDEGESPAVE